MLNLFQAILSGNGTMKPLWMTHANLHHLVYVAGKYRGGMGGIREIEK